MTGLQPSGGEEVQLWTTKKEQSTFGDLSDLYSIIVAVEKLEKVCLHPFAAVGTCPSTLFCHLNLFLVAALSCAKACQRIQHHTKGGCLMHVPLQAYVRDAVSPKDYEAACQQLISKFKTLQAALRDNGVPSVEAFMVLAAYGCATCHLPSTIVTARKADFAGNVLGRLSTRWTAHRRPSGCFSPGFQRQWST